MKIIAATDLSVRSDRALQRAFEIARQTNGQVTVLHAVDDQLPESMRAAQVEAARPALESQLSSAWAGPTVAADIVVTCEHAVPALLNCADQLPADLIVLGVHRHTAWEMVQGTTSERVVRLGRFPVLIVKDPVSKPYERAIVATDLSIHSHAATLLAARLVPKGRVRLVNALHVPFTGFLGPQSIAQFEGEEKAHISARLEQEIETLRRELGPGAPQLDYVIASGDLREVVVANSTSLQGDLVALGAHGRSRIAYTWLGSATRDLLSDPPGDLLIAKAK